MTSCTSVVSYLLLCLMSVRGWWAREGDRIERPNVLMPPNHAKAQARRPYRALGFGQKMRVRGLEQTNGGLPTAALADEILLPGEGQIRALLNVGGSPMMAWPDQRKTHEALESLELLVTTDVEYSPTARMADYVVATKMTFETPSITQVTEVIKYFHPGYGFRAPYAQYTPALVDPPAGSDLIEDWQLYYRVAQRLGLSLNVVNVFGRMGAHLEAPIQVVPLDMEHEPTTDDLYEIMCRGSHVPLDEVKRYPHGHVFEELLDCRVGPSDPDSQDRLDVGNTAMLCELCARSATTPPPPNRTTTDRSCSCPVARTVSSTRLAARSPASCGAAATTPRSCTPTISPASASWPVTWWRSAPRTTPSPALPRATPTCAEGSFR
jgi:hypothetical protein